MAISRGSRDVNIPDDIYDTFARWMAANSRLGLREGRIEHRQHLVPVVPHHDCQIDVRFRYALV